MSKYYFMIEGNGEEKYLIPEIVTDHKVGLFLLERMVVARGFLYTEEGLKEFVAKILSNDNNKDLYPDILDGIKDIANFITGTFLVHRIASDELINGRKRKHLRFVIRKTLEMAVVHNQKVLHDHEYIRAN